MNAWGFSFQIGNIGKSLLYTLEGRLGRFYVKPKTAKFTWRKIL